MLASVASMIDQFNMSNIGLLKRLGYDVHVAANFEQGNTSSPERVRQFIGELEQQDIPWHQVDLSRNALAFRSNLKAFGQIMALLRRHGFRFLHCHSPMGGFCGRLAGRFTGTPVVYTAHGFHFYDGAPLPNWLLYYPTERLLAHFTDVLVTINHDDFRRAGTFAARKVVHVPGIGVDTKRLARRDADRARLREELGLADGTFVFLSVGELNRNKNHATALEAFAALGPGPYAYLICGRGERETSLREQARRLGLEGRVRFLGFRNDVGDLLGAADAFVFPSLREGLSVALLEAVAAGLPVVCSRIRGNTDLIAEGGGGFLVEPLDAAGFAERMKRLADSPELCRRLSAHNLVEARKYDVAVVNEAMKAVYEGIGGSAAARRS